MKKEFVPYEQALELKQLGFDKSCYANYSPNFKLYHPEKNYIFNLKSTMLGNSECKAPTFSQAFRWFREKYNLIPDIQYYGNWNFEIFRIGEFAEPMDDVNVDYTFKGGTYEETELECLKKLIEIVKKK